MNAGEQNRVSTGLRNIKIKWIVSTVVESAMIGFAYTMLFIHVVRHQEIMQSIRQGLSDYGLDSSVYTLIGVFSAFGIVVLSLSFVVGRGAMKPKRGGRDGRTPLYSLGRALSRYDTGVTISQLLVFLIPAAGIPLLLFTGGATEALAVIVAFWALGLVLTAPRQSEFMELTAQGKGGVVPGVSPGVSEPGRELDCTGMNLGGVRSPGGRLAVRPDELLIRSFWGLLGEYQVPANVVLGLHVESTSLLSGLQVRIEHGARDVPANIVLGFDAQPDEVFQEISSTGFAPRGSHSMARPNRGFPVRLSSMAALVVLWNCLVLLGVWVHWSYSVAAIMNLFAGSILIGKWPPLGAWLMKPGRDVGEIKPFLALTRTISAILLAVAVAVRLGTML